MIEVKAETKYKFGKYSIDPDDQLILTEGTIILNYDEFSHEDGSLTGILTTLTPSPFISKEEKA